MDLGGPPLRIYELALLLIVKDEQGTISVSHWDLVLAGAVLCELILEERLAVDVEADTCAVVDERPLDDVLLDGCLKLFLDAKRPIAAKHALHHICHVKIPGLEDAGRLRFADLYHAAEQRGALSGARAFVRAAQQARRAHVVARSGDAVGRSSPRGRGPDRDVICGRATCPPREVA